MGKLHVYRAEDGWRWSFKARNGKILADSGEAYNTRNKCVAGFVRLKNLSWDISYDRPDQ